MTRTPLSFTVFTSITPKLLSKSFCLTDGKLQKSSSADMSEGQARVVTCYDLVEFDDQLTLLTGSQALAYGVAPGHPDAKIRAADKLGLGDIARTKTFFQFAQAPGIMMLDHDSTIDGIAIEADTLYERLIEAVPELATASMLWRVSASSCITNDAGETLNGIKGQRLYIAVQDASLIPEAGKALVNRLWAAGMGWIEVGKAGQALKRTLVDHSVWQANRLDFAGPPQLGAGLTRLRPASRLFNDSAVLFDLRCIKTDADTIRKATSAQATATSEAKTALLDARTTYIALRAPEMAMRRGISVEAANTIMQRATDHNVLGGEFELQAQDGSIVTVGELLDLPTNWHGKNFADPLEPDYGSNNRTVARAHLRGGTTPTIRSFAHGGMTYRLMRPCRRIQLAVGQRARINDNIMDVMRERGEIYDFGEGAGMARVSGSTAVPVSRDWLNDHFDRTCEFYKIKNLPNGDMVEVAQDGPPFAANAIMAKHGERRLPRLDAVVTAPTLRRDGSVVDEPGYDKQSWLLYLCDGEGLKVPSTPTPDDALRALQRLWAPVSQFPFVGPEDRGVTLTAMVTAVLRGSLPTAPGFAFDAPSAGSGKTLLAKVIGILATGNEPSISSPSGQEEEMRKRLFASLREGAKVVLWDNLREPLGGASIDSFLTASTYTDRILGVSETASLPNRALFICTGNNLRLLGDTCRRVLLARIDPKSEQPFAREFAFDPATVVVHQRQQLVVDALTIIRAHITAGSPRVGKGRTASFELWDDLVRQPVIWVTALAAAAGGLPEFSDPLAVVNRQFENDPETQKLDAFMTSWHGAFEGTSTTVAKAIQIANLDDELLRDALDEIAGQNGRINPRILGRWVEKNRGRPHKGYRIERGTLRDGRQTWFISKDVTKTPALAVTH